MRAAAASVAFGRAVVGLTSARAAGLAAACSSGLNAAPLTVRPSDEKRAALPGADALHAAHHVGPVLERAFLALVEDLAGHARADALDGFELGLRGLVDIDGGMRGDGEEGDEQGDDGANHEFLQ